MLKFLLRRLFPALVSLLLFTHSDASAQWVQTLGPSNVESFAGIGSTLFAGTSDGLYRSTDNGQTWTIDVLDSDWTSSMLVIGNNVFAGTLGYGLYLSTDRGNHWVPITNGIGTTIEVFSLGMSGSNMVTGTSSGIFFSRDSGMTWNATSVTWQTNPLTTSGTEAFARGSQKIGTDTIYYSNDSGEHWVAEGPEPAFTYWLVKSGNFLFDGEGNGAGVSRSSNNGAVWQSVDSGLPVSPFFHCHNLAIVDNVLLAATDFGVFLTTDNGTYWQNDSANDNMDNRLYINVLYGWNGSVWAGTLDSVWREPISAFSSVPNLDRNESSVSLYPDPVKTDENIRVNVMQDGPIEISIVNAIGETVASVYRGFVSSGEHSWIWNASGLVPGSYECIVQGTNVLLSRPLVVLQ
jgi:hypothetical protein